MVCGAGNMIKFCGSGDKKIPGSLGCCENLLQANVGLEQIRHRPRGLKGTRIFHGISDFLNLVAPGGSCLPSKNAGRGREPTVPSGRLGGREIHPCCQEGSKRVAWSAVSQ